MTKAGGKESGKEGGNKEKEKIYNWRGLCSAGLNKKIIKVSIST